MKATHKVYRLTSERRMEQIESSLEQLKEIQEDLEHYLEEMRQSAEITLSSPTKWGEIFFPDAPRYEELTEIF